MQDRAHSQTDKIIAQLEKQIQQEYQKAYTEVRKEMATTLAKMQLAGDFKERFDLSMKYDRLTKLSERCSKIIRTAGVNATRIINQTEPNVYALNYNEIAGKLDVPVLPKSLVKKVVEGEINPYSKIAEMKLKNVDSIIGNFETALLNGFANGEGTTKIARRLKNLLETNTRDAQRIARTESTRIENQARNDVGNVGKEKYGLNIWKRWIATKDERTRDEHLQMDGVEVPFDEPFVLPNGDKMMFPGDISFGADASNTINCRCTIVEFVKETKQEDAETEVKQQPKKVEIPKQLTKEEENAVEYYVSGEGMYVNNYLANRTVDGVTPDKYWNKSQDDKLLKALDNATTKQEVKQDTLYRSVDASAIFPNATSSQLDDIKDELFYGQSYNKQKTISIIESAKGEIVKEPRFLSTTKDKEIALNFGGFTGAEHPLVIEFEVPNGIMGYDCKKFEVEDDPQKEVLLQRNLKYKILDIGVATSKDGMKSIYVKARFIK